MPQQSQILPECLALIAQTTHNLGIQKLPRRVVLLMGSSKAGKTTLLYYLLGMRLNLVTNDLGVSVLQPEAIYHNAYIGDGYESSTVYPNIPPDCGVDDLIIVDMPGFDDTRPTYKLINFYILLEVLKMFEEVHICQVIEQMFVDSDQLQRQIQKICEFINQDLLQTDRALSFIITKVEEQECIQKFEANLQSIISQTQNVKIKNQMQSLLKSRKYMFKNEKPKLEEGIELKQKIIEESVFVKIEKKPEKFLSPSFCDFMIGETNIEQFRGYLNQLLLESEFTILHLVRLFFAMIRYEYSETIAFFEDLPVEEIRKSAFADIKINKEVILVNQLNLIQVEMNYFQIGYKSHLNLIKILKFQHEFQLLNWIQCLACHFQTIEAQNAFPKKLSEALHSTFKELHGLLSLLFSIQNQLKQITNQILDNSIIKGQILQSTKFWHENIQKLQSKSTMPQTTYEFYKIYCSQFGSAQIKEQIVYVYSYKQIKNNQLKKLLKSPKQNHIQKQPTKIKHSALTLKQIQNLPLNTSVLESILEMILQYNKNNNFLKVLINKAANIFAYFSYLQEAIMFYIAVSDHTAIAEIVQIGLHQGFNISTSFVRQILIKYLINIDWPYHNQICICYNYLCSFASNQDQFIQSQLEFVDYLKTYSLGKTTPRENIETRPAVELFFIQPILQRRQKYMNLLKLRERQFQESPCSALLTSSAISQIMK